MSFTVRQGETLALVGESGSGKSTIARAVLRLVPVHSGRILFDGQDLARLSRSSLTAFRRQAQIIFQDPYGSLNPRRTAAGSIREALEIHHLGAKHERAARVAELLSLVGLRHMLASRFPRQLSGGERQRVAIARALAVEPRFVVCDEPVSALDVSTRAQILNVLRKLQVQLDLTYLFIGHDLPTVRHLSDRIAVIYLGQIIEIGPTDELFREAAHPYTLALIQAAPIPNPRLEAVRKRMPLVGEIPSPIDPPSGCRFHTRCWLYRRLGEPRECRLQEPKLQPIGPAHSSACHFSKSARSEFLYSETVTKEVST